ncbi:hypothetical protein [Reichenbachiella faecimaris]|nr:hypothetical protein [Reichenbachiella faecimaris]
MEKQISETKTDRFNKSFLSDKIVLVEKNKVEGTRNKKNLFPKMPLYEISKPLFSKSGHIALLYEEVHCGIECGGAQVIILVKNDDLWNQVGTIPISLR